MKTAVILSTYNAPELLAPTLAGYAAQLHRDFELIVADDGSREETRRLIEGAARQYRMPIRHVWHDDKGFRKCRILNQAVLATSAEYLIFSDGDCIPRSDFVLEHVRRARVGRFLSGGYLKLNQEASRLVRLGDVFDGNAFDFTWLVDSGMRANLRLRRLSLPGWAGTLLNGATPTRPTWNGHNSSAWRDDVLRVNGFDERMAYWAQDREFGERLVHAGIRGVQVRYSALCVHLYHDRPYKTERSRERNKQIRRETRAARSVWTQYGIIKGSFPVQSGWRTPATERDVRVDRFQTT